MTFLFDKMTQKISPDRGEAVLKAGGYLERKDERLRKRTPRFVTRLYDAAGVDQGVANYTRTRLERMCKLRAVSGPNGEQRWILK